MIVDVHTHAFPPELIADRERLAADDAGFAALYAGPRARMATADELLAAMDAAGVDRAVAAGFAWRSPERCEQHAAYLLDAAARSGGRLLPFVPVPTALLCAPEGDAAAAREWLAPIVERGAAGLGEIRLGAGPRAATLEEQAAAGERLAALVAGHDLPLLVHASEEAGHAYPGKAGGFTPGGLWRLLAAHPVRVIAAHWGGGLPFFARMPEVRALLDEGRLLFDSAASALLYEPAIFETAADLAGAGHVAWGSDFPLREIAADRAAVEAAVPDAALRDAILGDNARRFFGLG
jgi:predicted TIM-barrel fold metal-dependent hydrolase